MDVVNLNVGFLSGSTGTVYVEDAGSTLDIGAFLVVGKAGTGTLNINDGGQVTVANGNAPVIGANAGSSGAVNVSGGEFSLGTNGLVVGAGGTGALNIANGGLVAASQLSIGDPAARHRTVPIRLGVDQFPHTVGLDGNGKLIIGNGGLVSLDNGAATLHAATNAGSVGEVIIGDGSVPAGVLSAAAVEFGAGAGFLIFNHTDTSYDFATTLVGAGTLFQLAGATSLTGDNSGFTGTSNVDGGSLYVNNLLGGAVNVNGGTLGGSGTLTGPVTINTGSVIAPGNSIGVLTVADLTINPGSTYEVELNDGGTAAGVNNDHIRATGTVIINGGTVHVTPENGTDDGSSYTPGSTYVILQAFGSAAGTFDAVSDDYAFLDFTLWYDPDNVFLTSSALTGFCLTDMTANQCAVGDGLFSLGASSLFTAVALLSDSEAPGALDQLSGGPPRPASAPRAALGPPPGPASGGSGPSALASAWSRRLDVGAAPPPRPRDVAPGGVHRLLGQPVGKLPRPDYSGLWRGLLPRGGRPRPSPGHVRLSRSFTERGRRPGAPGGRAPLPRGPRPLGLRRNGARYAESAGATPSVPHPRRHSASPPAATPSRLRACLSHGTPSSWRPGSTST